MPLQSNPSFKSTNPNRFVIPKPGIGGLNLNDLEYALNSNQTPYMLNMMYRNGSFGKRYGQEVYKTFSDNILRVYNFSNELFVHAGTKMYKNGVEIANFTLPSKAGLFITFYQDLFYLCDGKFYEYSREDDGTKKWKDMEVYTPEIFYSAEPQKLAPSASAGESGYGGDKADDYNILSDHAIESYNGNGTSTEYYIKGLVEYYVWDKSKTEVKIDDVVTTAYTMNETDGKIVFNTAPAQGGNNVTINWTLKEDALKQDRDRLMASKYAIAFGGSNSSRLFLAGGGDSKYFYSESYDARYFPENNWAVIGNSAEDITGFGLQYNVLMIFKPEEIHQLRASSVNTYNTSGDLVTEEVYQSYLVNSQIGCNCPYTIQLIDNKLTWFSTKFGICTIVSSNIIDERNVRQISRNIDRTNNFNVKGILDYDENVNNIVSTDFDNKYFLVFPTTGHCFMWDYKISPYYYTSSKETDVKILDFFLFDKFYVGEFVKVGLDLCYSSSYGTFKNKLIKLNNTYTDLDFDGDSRGDAINSYYMTPFMQFDTPDWLKTVTNMYVQCRSDVPTRIKMSYYTEEDSNGIQEGEDIIVYSNIWNGFSWGGFGYDVLKIANTVRRKISLKKVQMVSVKFENNVKDCDLSLSFIGFDYQNVKRIK